MITASRSVIDKSPMHPESPQQEILGRRAGCIFLGLVFLCVPILTHYTLLNRAKGAIPFIPYRVPAENKMLRTTCLIKLEELNTMYFTESQQNLAIKKHIWEAELKESNIKKFSYFFPYILL